MMNNAVSAIWQKTSVPFRVAMQRTYRTYERTHERFLRHGRTGRLLNAPGSVDNRVRRSFEVHF